MDGVSPRLVADLAWERSPGVVTPELAATWCSLSLTVDGNPVTLVADARGGGFRRRVHTSAYPLAEWIATRWWFLNAHVRPSAVSADRWRFSRSPQHLWLRHHNVRGAGGGMPWPDLTVVPEGGVTRLVWHAAAGTAGQPVTFLTSGDSYLPAREVRDVLTQIVVSVLDRLAEAGVRGTTLQEEWEALEQLDVEERQFAAAAARLGLDPFDVDADITVQLEAVSQDFEGSLLDEFLDSADPARLLTASEWLHRAKVLAIPGTATGWDDLPIAADGHSDRPWQAGYAAASRVREHLQLDPRDKVDLDTLVATARVSGDSAGLQGLVAVRDGAVGLALPQEIGQSSARRFAQARALGLSVLEERTLALLDPTGTVSAKTSRAFAAELLAPAEGIAAYLREHPQVNDRALEAVARSFGTSPLLVQRQYDNQLA